MFGDEISIDPVALIQLEHDTRIWSVCCQCGYCDKGTQKELEAAGWRLDKSGEWCPKEKMLHKIEIIQFKESGKFYTTIGLEVDGEHLHEVIDQVRDAKNRSGEPTFSWLITGKGMKYGVPHLVR